MPKPKESQANKLNKKEKEKHTSPISPKEGEMERDPNRTRKTWRWRNGTHPTERTAE
jgi:hypothetical protein